MIDKLHAYIHASAYGWLPPLLYAFGAVMLVTYSLVYLGETVYLSGALDNIAFVVLFTAFATLAGSIGRSWP